MSNLPHSRMADDDPEARCRGFFDRMPVGLFRTTTDGQFLDANPALARMLGYPGREALLAANANAVDLYVNPGECRQWQALVERDEVVLQFETQWRRLDGTVIWVEENARFLRDAEGRTCYEGSAQDVTGRKHAETQLRLAEAKYRSLVEQVPAAMYIDALDEAASTIYISPQVEAILGYPPAEWQADAGLWPRLLHPDDREQAVAETARHIASSEPLQLEYRMLARTGQVVWIRDEAVIVRDESGRPLVSQGVMFDVTERKRAEEALRESEARYRTLFSAAERREQEAALLDQVHTALARELDLPVLLRSVVEAIARTFGYTQVSLYLLQGDRLLLQHQVGYDHVISEIPISKGISGRAVRAAQPVLLEDARSDPAFLGAIEGIVSEVCVPLFDQGRVAGTLNVESTNGVGLGEADLRLMVALSQHVGVALGRARLYSEAREAERIQSVLFHISQATSLTGSVEELLKIIREQLSTLMDTTNFYVALYDKERELYSFPYIVDEYDGSVVPTPRQMQRSLTDYVRRTGAPLLVDEEIHQQLAEHGEIELVGTQSPIWLGVPLKTPQGIIGVVVLQSYKESSLYSARDLELLTFVSDNIALTIERKRAEEELLARERHLTLLNTITRAALATSGLQATLQALADHLAELLHADNCSISLWDEATQTPLAAAASLELREAYPAAQLEPGEVTLTASVLRAGHALAVEDVFNTPYISPRVAALFPARSILGLPLIAADRRLGAAVIAFNQRRHFTPDEIARGEQAAGQVALAVVKAQSFEATQRQLKELTVLHTVAAAAAEATSEDALIERVTQVIGATLYPDNFGVLLLTERESAGVLRHHSSFRGIAASQGRPELILPGQGVTGRVAATGQTLRIADVTREAEYMEFDPLALSELCVPIKSGDHVLGVLDAESVRPDAFTEADERLLATIAGQLATGIEKLRLFEAERAAAIENARLFGEAQRREVELATLLDVARAVSSSLDLREVLRHVAISMARALRMERCALSAYEPGAGAVRTLVEYFADGEPEPMHAGEVHWLANYPSTQRVIESGQALVIRADDPQAPPAEAGLLNRTRDAALLMLALRASGRAVGLAKLFSHDGSREFTSGDLRLAGALADQAAVAIENARLFEATRRQLDELTALHAVATAGAEATSEDALIERVTQIIGETLYPDNFGVLLLTERQAAGVLSVHPSYRIRAEGWSQIVPLGRGIVGQVAATGRSWRVPEVSREPGYVMIDPEMRSELCVPLKTGERVIGVINAESRLPSAFSEADERLLTTLAGQMATAIEKARLLAETIEALTREQRLNGVARIISGALDLPTILQSVVRLAAELVAADAGSLALLAPGGDTRQVMSFSYVFNLPEEYSQLQMPKGAGIAWQIMGTGESVLLADYRAHPEALPALVAAGVRGFLGVPLVAGDDRLGALGLFHLSAEGRFTERDRALAESVGRQAGVAIQNARLFEAERRRVEALTALHEISLDLSAQFDLPVLLHIIVERAARLLDATAGAVYLPKPDGQTLEQVVSYNLGRDFAGAGLRWGEELAGRIVQTGEPLVVGSYDEWPYRAAAYADASLRAAVGVPIKWQGRVIGTLNIAAVASGPGRFGPADVELLSLFADQAAVAIENARLYTSAQKELAERKRAQEQLEQTARQLTSLSHMGQTVAASLDLTEVLEHVIEEVSAILGAEGVSILLLDPRHPDELVFAAVQGVGTEGLPGKRMPATAGVAGEVMRTGHSLLVSGDEGQTQIYREIERVSGYHTQALVAAPLKLENEVIGVMEAVHTRHGAFGAVAPRLLEAAANWAAIAIGNARRHENIQRHLQESQAMAAISRALNETLDLGRVLQLIVDSARQIIPNVEQAVIHLLDEERQALRPAAVAGLRAELGEPDLTMRPGEGIVGRVIAEGSLINVSDVQADPRFLPRGPATGLRSLMVASVQSGTRRLGAISVQSAAPRAYSSEDERLLATLGAQAALAIENARFFEIERRRAEEAETLQHVTQTLISRLDLFEMLAAVVEAIATMGNCQYVSVFLLERDRLVLHANRGYLRSAPGPYSLRLDEGLVGRVARTGIPTLIPDVMKQDEEYQAAIPRGAVQSAIGVPLIHAGGMLGVLLIESTADRVLDDRDLRWLTNVGRQLSVAIENTRLYADLEEALQQEKATRARLVQSEKLAAMGRLVASVAHELNNPLQAIQNALYLVGQVSQLGTQAREDLQVAMTEADRMAGLIGRLRESYRPTAAQEFRAEALDTVVKEVRKLIGTHLRHNNVTFEFDADAALPAVAGIHDQLKQVFLNLCLNAVEAMPGGGRLTIGMRHEAESGQVLVTVADTGIGIDPAALPNVFDPFYTTKEGGTGLGLAITYDIIQRHNGRVEVESKPGPEGGTVFKVWLPVGQMTSSGYV